MPKKRFDPSNIKLGYFNTQNHCYEHVSNKVNRPVEPLLAIVPRFDFHRGRI